MKNFPALERLEEELKKVMRELRVDVPRELKLAAAHGDLSENSEYDAAKQRQSFLQARASQLAIRVEALSSLKLDDLPGDAVAFGSKVYLEDLDTGDEVTYELVTPEEVDPRNGKISVGSPIGKALLNKAADDEIRINLPTGVKEYSIIKIETLHELLGE
jgi:transcription elongation factor GreA